MMAFLPPESSVISMISKQTVPQKRERQTLSVKGPSVNIIFQALRAVLCQLYLLHPAKAATDNAKVNGCGRVPIKLDLQKQAVADLAHRPVFPVPGPKETNALERTLGEARG